MAPHLVRVAVHADRQIEVEADAVALASCLELALHRPLRDDVRVDARARRRRARSRRRASRRTAASSRSMAGHVAPARARAARRSRGTRRSRTRPSRAPTRRSPATRAASASRRAAHRIERTAGASDTARDSRSARRRRSAARPAPAARPRRRALRDRGRARSSTAGSPASTARTCTARRGTPRGSAASRRSDRRARSTASNELRAAFARSPACPLCGDASPYTGANTPQRFAPQPGPPHARVGAAITNASPCAAGGLPRHACDSRARPRARPSRAARSARRRPATRASPPADRTAGRARARCRPLSVVTSTLPVAVDLGGHRERHRRAAVPADHDGRHDLAATARARARRARRGASSALDVDPELRRERAQRREQRLVARATSARRSSSCTRDRARRPCASSRSARCHAQPTSLSHQPGIMPISRTSSGQSAITNTEPRRARRRERLRSPRGSTSR